MLRKLHTFELRGNNFSYRGIDWNSGGVLEGPVRHIPQVAGVGERCGGLTPGGNHSHHPADVFGASGELQTQNAVLSGSPESASRGQLAAGQHDVAEIEQRVGYGTELQMGVALRPKMSIFLEQNETTGEKIYFCRNCQGL